MYFCASLSAALCCQVYHLVKNQVKARSRGESGVQQAPTNAPIIPNQRGKLFRKCDKEGFLSRVLNLCTHKHPTNEPINTHNTQPKHL